MEVVAGVEGLRSEHGPIFAVVGVFDGLHLGHAYLLEHLVREAADRSARPCVITFDAHPDEVLTGSAPPLLIHPDERLARLEAAGVEVTVVQHFDEAVRRSPYDVFVATIMAGTSLAGLLMTHDAAFGFQRTGTPEALAVLGRERGFDIVVVPTFSIDDRPVRSSEIRSLIATGDLQGAAELLGRPVTLRGELRDRSLVFDLPLALPGNGTYACVIDGVAATLTVRESTVTVDGAVVPDGPADVILGS